MKNILKRYIIVFCLLALAALTARSCVRDKLDEFPPEQVYLRFTSPDGSTAAVFSLKHESLRWVSDVEPACYITLVDLEQGRVMKRAEKFLSFNMRENFLALAREHAPWCVAQIEANSGPHLQIQQAMSTQQTPAGDSPKAAPEE
jgi:hypothetical protein